jgi:hypothetical protein
MNREQRLKIAEAYEVAETEINRLNQQVKSLLQLINTKPDNYTVQSCCLAYGGNSFPGPMEEALITHLSILNSRATGAFK